MSRFGSDAKEAVAAIIDTLSDVDQDVRERAMKTLGEIGPEAGAAVPTLIKALKDTEPGIRVSAAAALYYIGSAATNVIPDFLERRIKTCTKNAYLNP